jgi:hypothetical protein
MRRIMLVLPLLFACAKGGEAPADSAAMAATPAALTEADVMGTWSGTLMPAEGSDSVLAHWTVVIGGGTYRLTTTESPKDTVTGTYVLEGDSSRYSAGPYADAQAGGAMVTDAGTTRFSGNQISGTGATRLAAKPDSVLLRYRFAGTKNP